MYFPLTELQKSTNYYRIYYTLISPKGWVVFQSLRLNSTQVIHVRPCREMTRYSNVSSPERTSSSMARFSQSAIASSLCQPSSSDKGSSRFSRP